MMSAQPSSHIVEPADCDGVDALVGRCYASRFSCEKWLLDRLAALGAGDEDREEDDAAEGEDPRRISMPNSPNVAWRAACRPAVPPNYPLPGIIG